MYGREHAITVMRRRIAGRLAMRYATMLSTAWIFAWGACVLGLRVSRGYGEHVLPVGFAGVLWMILGGIVLAWRKRPGAESISALLDSRNASGGMVVTARYADMREWTASIGPISLPGVRWLGRRTGGLLCTALLFAAGSVLIPVHHPALAAGGRLQIRELIEELGEQCEVLEELEVLDERRAEDIAEQLDRAWEESSAQDPARTWETLDHIEKTLTERADETASELLAQAQEIAGAEVSARALSEMASHPMAGDDVTQAMGELADLMKDLEIDPRLLTGLDTNLLAGAGDLTPEQLAALSDLLKASEGRLTDMLEKMCRARLVDPSTLKKCKQCRLDADAELAAFLERSGCNSTNALLVCKLPGRGGINRGRGDAAMTWTDGTSENDVRFNEENLSPAALADLKESRLLGLGTTDPTVTETDVSGTGSALSAARAGGGTAHRQPILPKHRSTVTQYFERKE